MPLSKDEFDAGGEPATPVLDYLRGKADEAFTLGELAAEFHDTSVTLDDLDYALTMLATNRVLETNLIDGKVYYMYRR